MRRFHFSLGTALVAISLCAFTCALMRQMAIGLDSGAIRESGTACAVGGPPMANVLVFTGLVMIQNLRRTGECRPFLTGFGVVGAASFAAYFCFFAWQFQNILAATELLEAGMARVGISNVNVVIGAVVAPIFALQLGFAAFGGCVFARFRIKLVVEPRESPPRDGRASRQGSPGPEGKLDADPNH